MTPHQFGLWTKISRYGRSKEWKQGIWLGWLKDPSRFAEIAYYEDGRNAAKLKDDGQIGTLWVSHPNKFTIVRLLIKSLTRKIFK